MRIVRKQARVMGRMLVRTPTMDSRVPKEEVWVAPAVPHLVNVQMLESLAKANPRDACIDCKFFTQGRYGLGKCGFHHDVRTIDDTCEHWAPRMQVVMLIVNPEGGKYRHERKADPGEFDKRSFRTVVQGKHRVIVGCPTGQWDDEGKKCKVGTRAQSILHPRKERKKKNPDGSEGCGFIYVEETKAAIIGVPVKEGNPDHEGGHKAKPKARPKAEPKVKHKVPRLARSSGLTTGAVLGGAAVVGTLGAAIALEASKQGSSSSPSGPAPPNVRFITSGQDMSTVEFADSTSLVQRSSLFPNLKPRLNPKEEKDADNDSS